MLPKWRLLDTGVQNASYNMALEKVLLTSCAKGIASNTLHLLEFTPCVLLGYNQKPADVVNEAFCRENNIEINRRISGGGCIYMDSGTLGWEITAKKNTKGIPGNLNEMYRLLCGGTVSALKKFGIDASYKPINDVLVDGRKLSGAGGTELDDSFIFHGSVLVDFDADTMMKALKLPVKKDENNKIPDIKTQIVCMRELLGAAPSMKDVKDRLANAFAEILGIEFEIGGLESEESNMLYNEVPLFASKEWIYEKQLPDIKNMNVYEHKTGSGPVRITAE